MWFSFKNYTIRYVLCKNKNRKYRWRQEEEMSYNSSRCFSRDICLQSGITVFYVFQFHCNHLLIPSVCIYCIICRVWKKFSEQIPYCHAVRLLPSFLCFEHHCSDGAMSRSGERKRPGFRMGPNPQQPCNLDTWTHFIKSSHASFHHLFQGRVIVRT